MKINNDGVSLIELVISIAILTVLVSSAILGFSFYSKYPGKQCVNNLKTSLVNGRVTALGKNDYSLVVGKETDGSVYICEVVDSGTGPVVGEHVKVGDKSVAIKYYTDSNPDPIELADGSAITFKFKRETGGFNFDGVPVITKIDVIKSKTFTLKLSRFTGKVVLE